MLERLRDKHPVVELILYYRQLSKLKSTYADGLLKVIDPADGRIHTTFRQTLTQTGRLSSVEPNLQNIPVRTGLGRTFRKFFVAAPGCLLVDADYSQIELRVLAHISEDETLIAAFNAGADIHTITASQVFGVSPELVTGEMRKRARRSTSASSTASATIRCRRTSACRCARRRRISRAILKNTRESARIWTPSRPPRAATAM